MFVQRFLGVSLAMSRLLLSLLAVTVLAALTVLGVHFLLETRPEAARLPPREVGPVPVMSRWLEPGPVTVTVEGFGTLDALRRADLAPELGGRVVERFEPWNLGRRIEAGTMIVALDASLLESEERMQAALLTEAKAALSAAQVELEAAGMALPHVRESLVLAEREEARLQKLSSDSFASESQLDAASRGRTAAATALENARARERGGEAARVQAESVVASAEAALDLARERRSLTELRAPFDGYLASEGPRVGDYLPLGLPFARLVDLSRLRVVLQITEEEFAQVQLGQRAMVVPQARPGRSLAGRVVGLGAEADPTLRSFPVEVELEGAPGTMATGGETWGGLRPGQFVGVRIVTENLEQGLVLARGEFVWQGGVPTAFVRVDGSATDSRVEARVLELGPPVGEGFLIRAGLSAGERLIVAPLGRLEDGMACRESDPARTPRASDPARTPRASDPARTPGKSDPARTPGKGDPARTPGKGDPGGR
jgi:HlyD family secretion protein